MYSGSSSRNWSERMGWGGGTLERPLPWADPLTKPWHNQAVKSALLFKTPKAHISKLIVSLPSHWLLPLSINCPDCWGHESCNFLLASRGRASRMFAAGGTTRQLEEERGTNKRSLSAPGPTHQLSTSGSGVSSFKNIVCQHSTAVRVRTRGGNSRRTERSSSSRSLRRAA